ncbi:MAG: Asp-tRNA(Asn)/Glu-tRNA(Gln) amidotransferase subunit GatC [Caldisericia bacterium]
MKIKDEDIKRVSKLAMISFDDDKQLQNDITSLLESFSQIRDVDLSGVPPMTHPTQCRLMRKKDEPGKNLDKDKFISQSPKSKDDYILVPKIISEQE